MKISNPVIELTLSAPEITLNVGSANDVPLVHDPRIPSDAGVYEGEYTVVSSLEGQTLATARKYLKDDVVIKPLPQSEVANHSGGTTFYIGKVVED